MRTPLDTTAQELIKIAELAFKFSRDQFNEPVPQSIVVNSINGETFVDILMVDGDDFNKFERQAFMNMLFVKYSDKFVDVAEHQVPPFRGQQRARFCLTTNQQ